MCVHTRSHPPVLHADAGVGKLLVAVVKHLCVADLHLRLYAAVGHVDVERIPLDHPVIDHLEHLRGGARPPCIRGGRLIGRRLFVTYTDGSNRAAPCLPPACSSELSVRT